MIELTLKTQMKKIFEEEYKYFNQNFITSYSIEGDKRSNIEEKDNNITYLGLNDKTKYYSSILRSYDSSIGNLYEKIMARLAKLGDFKNIEQIDSYELDSDEKNAIKNFDTATKISDYIFSDLEYKNYSDKKEITIDLLLKKKINNVDIYYIFEIKTGGDLDNKKAQSEKKALFEKCIYLYKYLIKKYDKDNSKFKIEAFFSTIYNKNSLDGGTNQWIQERVRDNFDKEELLIGKDFFSFVCNNSSKELWELIKDTIRNANVDTSKKINTIINNISKEKIILKAFNTLDITNLPTDIYFNSIKLKINDNNSNKEMYCYIIHDKTKILTFYINSELLNCHIDEFIEKNCCFENIYGFKNLLSKLTMFKYNKTILYENLNNIFKAINKNKKGVSKEDKLYWKDLQKIIDSKDSLEQYNNLDSIKKEDFLKDFITAISKDNASVSEYTNERKINNFTKYISETKFKNEKTAFVQIFKKSEIKL